MSPKTHSASELPAWTWIVPSASAALLLLILFGVVSSSSPLALAVAGVFLVAAVFASVHHAEVIALRVGEPFGSIILAISVTVIEVALLVSIMLSAKEGGDVIARDTVYATVMITLNGIVGLCLILGGARHYEQSFQTNAAAVALSVLTTLAFITLILPNYTRALPGPVYADSQLIFVGAVSLILYGAFIFVQTIRHRDYFLSEDGDGGEEAHAQPPTARMALASLALLSLSLVSVVLLAKIISPWLETAVASAGLPKQFVGVIIAAIVLMPEGLASLAAARKNRLQTSLNLALGSSIATIGLTIPIVSLTALILGQHVTLGLLPEEMSLLLVTLFIGTITLATGRTTILQGSVHFVIFAVFLFLSAIP